MLRAARAGRISMARQTPTNTNQDLFPTSFVRGGIDSLVQGSLVELFAAYGVAVAPVPRMAGYGVAGLPEVSVGISFRCNARPVGGKLTLSLPRGLLDHMKAGETASVKVDWARELANQLIGRIKNRLLSFALRLDVGVSLLLEARELRERLLEPRDVRVYGGRTLRGPMLVTLQGLPDDASLRYVGGTSASEGSMIWL